MPYGRLFLTGAWCPRTAMAKGRPPAFDSLLAISKNWDLGEDTRIPLTAKIRRVAQNLVHGSRAPTTEPFLSPAPSFQSFEKLQRPLQAMAGAEGSQTLLSRALVLTKAEFLRLAGASLDKKGTVQGLAKIDPPLTQQEADESEVLLIGNTVELLCLFLGEAMALRLIQDQWPEASFVDEEPAKEGTA